jgi:hypothetical protein
VRSPLCLKHQAMDLCWSNTSKTPQEEIPALDKTSMAVHAPGDLKRLKSRQTHTHTQKGCFSVGGSTKTTLESSLTH